MHWLALLIACADSPQPVDSEVVVDALLADTMPISITPTPCSACDGGCVVEELEYATRYHTSQPIDYASTPPAGGPHNYCWADWGIHEQPVADDHWVHNLEHGGVVLLYECPDGCPEEQAAIEALGTTLADKVIVSAYPEGDTPFAAASWNFRLRMDCYDENQLDLFYQEHVDNGPESSMSPPPDGCH